MFLVWYAIKIGPGRAKRRDLTATDEEKPFKSSAGKPLRLSLHYIGVDHSGADRRDKDSGHGLERIAMTKEACKSFRPIR
ncbi:MAG: hypothetical protein R6U40_03025 [Desulfobacterales bacterium]